MSQGANGRGVLCVGRVYCDLVFTDVPRLPTLGTEVFAGGLSLHPGGGAAITAAYLAALGRPSYLGAYWPAPPFHTVASDGLEALGVDCRFAKMPAAGAQPQVTVAMASMNDRAFLTRDSGPAAPEFAAADLRAAGIGHMHIGELKSLVERPDLLDVAAEAGLTVSLDCGWDDRLTAQAEALIARVDIFLPNEEETAQLAGLGIAGLGRQITAVKCGAQGARAIAGTQTLHCAARQTEVIDTTGAGDAFNGGFLDAWMDGRDMQACLAAGVTCGALAVASAGGTGGAHALRLERRDLAAAQ